MQIHEVEAKLGLTKKSIRYYEAEGLFSPKRNDYNDYREYSEEDIKALKLIKFLRNLNVPINDIKRLKNGEITLQDCMIDRIKKIEEQEKNLEKIKNMCLDIEASNDSFQDINIDNYMTIMNILKKEGFTLKQKQKSHQRKIMGAVLSSLVCSIFFIFLIGLISYFQFTESSKLPVIIYMFLIIILGFPVISIGVNLFRRIKEIRGGEEDEASKY